jgi:hypothetical protein
LDDAVGDLRRVALALLGWLLHAASLADLVTIVR